MMQGFSASSGISRKKTTHRAFADFCHAGFEQTLDHSRQAIVVKTLAALDVVMDIEHLVNVFELLHRKRDAFVPDIDVFRVARLQLHQFLATCFAHLRILCRSFICFLVNANDLGDRIALQAPRDPANFSSRKSPSRTACPNRRCDCRG